MVHTSNTLEERDKSFNKNEMRSFKKITQELRKPDTCVFFFYSIDDFEKRKYGFLFYL